MCLLARIDNREFMCFYTRNRVELRDEEFQSVILPDTEKIMIKSSAKSDWYETTPAHLLSLAKTQMEEALSGLKSLAS